MCWLLLLSVCACMCLQECMCPWSCMCWGRGVWIPKWRGQEFMFSIFSKNKRREEEESGRIFKNCLGYLCLFYVFLFNDFLNCDVSKGLRGGPKQEPTQSSFTPLRDLIPDSINHPCKIMSESAKECSQGPKPLPKAEQCALWQLMYKREIKLSKTSL